MRGGDAPVSFSRISVAGGDLNCAASGAGAALLLLHGWTLDARMWAPQLAGLRASHLVIAPDRRGFGLSTAPPDLSCEPGDAIAVLDAFGVERAVIVGMSQAGRIALGVAQQHPERVAGLVLHGAGVAAGPEIPLARYRELVRAGQLDAMRKDWREHALMATTSRAARAAADAMLDDYGGRDLREDVRAGPDPDAAALAAITAPTLVVTGAQDTALRRAAADALARMIPDATRAEIADAGHLCNLDRPEAYNAALSRFLATMHAPA